MRETYEIIKNFVGARKFIADWSLTKIEDTNLKLFEYVRKKSDLKILEIGSGRGYFCNRFNEEYPKNKYFVIEYEAYNLEYGFKLGFFDGALFASLGSVYSLPFENDQFDIVVASEVLEHLKHLDLALFEINRVLKANGYVVASVPNSLMYLYPFPLMVSLYQSLRHYKDDEKGFKLLMKRLKRLADDNSNGIYHRPFLPFQFRNLFKKYNYNIIKHLSSILYFYSPPFSNIIEKHPNSLTIKFLTKRIIKISDLLLEKDVPLVKHIGIRQHILAKKRE